MQLKFLNCLEEKEAVKLWTRKVIVLTAKTLSKRWLVVNRFSFSLRSNIRFLSFTRSELCFEFTGNCHNLDCFWRVPLIDDLGLIFTLATICHKDTPLSFIRDSSSSSSSLLMNRNLFCLYMTDYSELGKSLICECGDQETKRVCSLNEVGHVDVACEREGC